MITRDQATYAELRFGVVLPTWLDAQDLDPATAALARVLAKELRQCMAQRDGLRRLVQKHRADADYLLALLTRGEAFQETLPHRPSMREAAERLALREDTLQALVLAFHEATSEPHP
jgi:hypothetical protein